MSIFRKARNNKKCAWPLTKMYFKRSEIVPFLAINIFNNAAHTNFLPQITSVYF